MTAAKRQGMRGPFILGQSSADARDALQPILQAAARGGSRLSKWRVLDVCCVRQHRLLQVVQAGSAGLVVVAEMRSSHSYTPEEAPPHTEEAVERSVTTTRHRAEPGVSAG